MRAAVKQAGRLSWGVMWSLALAMVLLLTQAMAVTVQTMSPRGEVAKVRQARVTFSDSMVRFGDPRLPSPYQVSCQGDKPISGTSRWVDDKTWVYDFNEDIPAGTRCGLLLKAGTRSISGESVNGDSHFNFNTGGPLVVRAYPHDGESSKIEEDQIFAFLLSGMATPASIEKHGYCEISGIAERIALKVITGKTRSDILKAVDLVPQQERVAMVQCARPLPPDAKVQVVWGKGIATPSGVPNSAERRLSYKVRPPFSASFTCERSNARANCLPIRPMRIE
ncbi:MAG TPA: alpha-2-macroglobulin, partial [Aquabacterium sp.]|nr:alpha-2-macroglobulin [Aquabacterium sp.]